MRPSAWLVDSIRARSFRRPTQSGKDGGKARLSLEPLESRCLLGGGPLVISELMAINDSFLPSNPTPGFSAHYDWIEIYNPTTEPINLKGWYLTDNESNLTKWRFPAGAQDPDIWLQPGRYFVVFASGSSQPVVGTEYHTNFALAGGGEYLALVMPDATGPSDRSAISHEYYPRFPPQVADISYGLTSATVVQSTILNEESQIRLLVPADGSLGQSWTAVDFDDSQWLVGLNGIGFDVNNPTGPYASLINTDVQSQMHGVSNSVYVRTEIVLNAPRAITWMGLYVHYDDGLVLYLNGQKVAQRNAPETVGYNSSATATRDGTVAEYIDLSAYRHLLREGKNVLAFHGLNHAGDGDDFLLMPRLAVRSVTPGSERYFVTPTPGAVNVGGALGLVAAPQASVERGLFDQPFYVSLTTDTPGAQIRYTLDGSKPTATTGFVYSGQPIYVGTTTTLRAAAFRAGYLQSKVVTHTYVFPARVATQSAPAGYPTTRSGIPIHYTMATDIVNNPAYAGRLVEALSALPTVSLVLPMQDFFGPSGIYMNPTQQGMSWERETSVEWIGTDGTRFQLNAGLRIQGGASRTPANSPKQSMSLRFRSDYGTGRLEFPLFEDTTVTSFDSLQLRGVYNNSWIHWDNQQRLRGQLIHDQWMRDSMLAMGNADAGCGRFVHVYINGLYWGVFNLHERQEASHYAAYNGGEEDQLDAVNGGNAVDGNLNSWNRMKATVQSLDWQAIQRVLDVDNFIDFTILHRFAGNQDLKTNGNWRAAGGGPNDRPWRFYMWDAERVLESPTNTNPPSPSPDPTGLFQYLWQIPEFRVRMADRLHKHLFHDGALTPEKNIQRYLRRAAELDVAIIAESARWGSYRRDVHSYSNGPYLLYERDVHWLSERNRLVSDYFPQRTSNVIARLRSDGWYPSLTAPSFSKHGGQVPYGYQLTMSAPSGTIYYTTDGSDPRLPGGGISPSATIFTASTVTTTIVPAGAVWKYLDDGSEQATAWRQIDFNDSSWAAGPAILGYGRPQVATTVGYGPDANNKYITTYFRHSFQITDPGAYTSLTLGIVRDDGAVVYLNGQEVVRTNMPSGAITSQTRASASVGDASQWIFNTFQISPSLLVAGTNVLAVSVHQVSPTSSDLAFDLRLQGVRMVAEQPVTLLRSGVVRARALDAGQWSALNEAMFYVGTAAAAGLLAITELNYNPYPPTAAEIAAGFVDPQAFEFIELRNLSTSAMVDLTGVRFSEGIGFDFTRSAVTILAPQQYVLVVKDLAAFEFRYGQGLPVAGTFTGQLDNSGEPLTLLDRFGRPIASFRYRPDGDWPWRCAGLGSTLEIVDPAGDPASAANWRASTEYGGSPGRAGVGPLQTIVINEVLTHTDPPLVDAVELLNLSAEPIDLSGWYLSDSRDNYFRYQFPTGQQWTLIVPGGYLVIDETHFNPGGGTLPNDFALSSLGEEVWLLAADATGKPTYFVDFVQFGAAANGESFGRWPDGIGRLYPMRQLTLGGPNSGPRVGPVIFSELMYAPPPPTPAELALCPEIQATDFEFVEIYNPTEQAINLTEWRLRKGVDFNFAPSHVLPAGGTIVVLPFDPRTASDKWAAFSLRYFGAVLPVPENFLGPYSGKLDNAGELVRLLRPDEPPPNNPTVIPRLIEDELEYGNSAPWPEEALGTGKSLQRLATSAWGHDPASWIAAIATPGQPVWPVAVADTAYVRSGRSVQIDVLANDAPSLGPLVPTSVEIVVAPSFGIVELDPLSGRITYTAGQSFVGLDGFAYRVRDVYGFWSNVAAVSVVVEPVPEVVGRYVFYNNSAFDGRDPAANQYDFQAIAPDKQPLLPGQSASFVNYTSYSRGINGIIVDIAGAPNPAGLGAEDFAFRVGNDSTAQSEQSTWTTAPAPLEVAVFPGAGVAGSTRVVLVWADNAIQNLWLEVTVRPTANTGLTEADVFYFGNAIGESGNNRAGPAADAVVDSADELAARDNRTGIQPADITNPYDFNRDRRVNSSDVTIARNHHSGANPLVLIDLSHSGHGSLLGNAAEPPAVDVPQCCAVQQETYLHQSVQHGGIPQHVLPHEVLPSEQLGPVASRNDGPFLEHTCPAVFAVAAEELAVDKLSAELLPRQAMSLATDAAIEALWSEPGQIAEHGCAALLAEDQLHPLPAGGGLLDDWLWLLDWLPEVSGGSAVSGSLPRNRSKPFLSAAAADLSASAAEALPTTRL